MIKEVASTGKTTSFHFLFRILFQPFLSAEVRQVLYLEILEGSIEAISVRAGRHETYHDRDVVLQPGVAHHDIFLVVEGIEDFHGIQPSDSLDPYVGTGLSSVMTLQSEVLWVTTVLRLNLPSTNSIPVLM